MSIGRSGRPGGRSDYEGEVSKEEKHLEDLYRDKAEAGNLGNYSNVVGWAVIGGVQSARIASDIRHAQKRLRVWRNWREHHERQLEELEREKAALIEQQREEERQRRQEERDEDREGRHELVSEMRALRKDLDRNGRPRNRGRNHDRGRDR